MNDIVVGIDLGTTYSAIAWVNEAGLVEVIPNAEGHNTTPSVVLIQNGRFIVGQEAANQALLYPADVVQCIKREIGSDLRIQGLYTPENISAEILRKLVRDAEAHLGRPIRRAVITVPAYFTDSPKEKTKQAGEKAGLVVEDLLHEPEAAAIFFGIDKLKQDERVLVCDLGGGTYDATLLQMKDGVLRAEGTRGSRKLGGHDWTNALMGLYAAQIQSETGVNPENDLSLWQRLHDLSEEAKRCLSTAKSATIPWHVGERSLDLVVERDEFEKACVPLMNEVKDKTAEAVLDAAGTTMDQIHHVILVGGSSRLPSFVTAIEEVTGKPARRVRNPDEAVASGAALVAQGFATGNANRQTGRITVSSRFGGRIAKTTIQRRTSHALGTMAYRRNSSGVEFIYERMIEENTDLPAIAEKSGFSIAPGQQTIQVPVLQLDNQNRVQEEIGNFVFDDLPLRDRNAAVLVRFRYDASGLANVSLIDVESAVELRGRRDKFMQPDLPTGELGSGEATVVLAIDCSGSMCGSKMDEAKNILSQMAGKYAELGRNWSVSVINFGGPAEIYPSKVLLPPSKAISQIRDAAEKLEAAGGTPMVAALQNIRTVLEAVSGTRLAIIITDGQPSETSKCIQTAQTLQALGIQIATVPVGSDANREFLKQLGQLESDVQVNNSGQGMADAVLNLLLKV